MNERNQIVPKAQMHLHLKGMFERIQFGIQSDLSCYEVIIKRM